MVGPPLEAPDGTERFTDENGSANAQAGWMVNSLRTLCLVQQEHLTEDIARPIFTPQSDLARFYLQISAAHPDALERLNHYETTLWRQACHIIFMLGELRRHTLDLPWLR
jgi:hypothetical protein